MIEKKEMQNYTLTCKDNRTISDKKLPINESISISIYNCSNDAKNIFLIWKKSLNSS